METLAITVGRVAALRTTVHASNKPLGVIFDLNQALVTPLNHREARGMKTFATFLAVLSMATRLFAQGTVNFANSSSTLISVGGVSMPAAGTRQFIFAVFLAPSTTVDYAGQTVLFDDPRFQLVGDYNTNHPTVAGRLITRNNAVVNYGLPGSTVDFVVRGWSANAGATWAEALASWNNGVPTQDMYIGTSTAGNDFVLGGGPIPTSTLFGLGSSQVGGFKLLNNPCIGPCLGPVWSYPISQTVVQGATVDFSVSIAACPPNQHYQWFFNGVAIPGATSRIYQIASAQPTGAGNYVVEVENGCQFPFVAGATLTVLVPPTITSPPSSQTAETGARVRLAVRVTGDLPLDYRWMFNGTNVLTGATSSVLELDNVGAAQSGSYTVAVTNAVGAVTSSPALLSVIAPVERRMVPRLTLSGQQAGPLHLEYSETVAPTLSWASLAVVDLTNSPGFYFDLSAPLPPQRFYRTWQTGLAEPAPALSAALVPAITLTGSIGSSVRLDYINQFGPTNAWFTLATVALTNIPQLYFDVSAIGQPPRLWRIVPLP